MTRNATENNYMCSKRVKADDIMWCQQAPVLGGAVHVGQQTVVDRLRLALRTPHLQARATVVIYEYRGAQELYCAAMKHKLVTAIRKR